MPRTAAKDDQANDELESGAGTVDVQTPPTDSALAADASATPTENGDQAPNAPPVEPRPTVLYWIGPMTPDGRPAEFFGGGPGVEPIPPRDLAIDEFAGMSEAQWELLVSPTGQRLYSASKPEPSADSGPETTEP